MSMPEYVMVTSIWIIPTNGAFLQLGSSFPIRYTGGRQDGPPNTSAPTVGVPLMPHLPTTPIHLGLGATATVEPPFTGMEWYAAYSARHAAAGAAGRLVAQPSFAESGARWRKAEK